MKKTYGAIPDKGKVVGLNYGHPNQLAMEQAKNATQTFKTKNTKTASQYDYLGYTLKK